MREFWGDSTVMYFSCVGGYSVQVSKLSYTPKSGFCLCKLKQNFKRFSSVFSIF